MNSVLITGGSGFLGHGLVAKLLTMGVQRICVYSRGEHRQADMRQKFPGPEMRWFIGDVRDRDRLHRAMRGVDTVIHAAALKRIEVGQYCPDEIVLTNVLGSHNVLEAAADAGVTRCVLVSSDKAVAPVNVYGASKLLAEQLFMAAPPPLSTAVARYGNVAGSTGSVIPRWRLPDPVMTRPECTRFWMDLEDAVQLVVNVARSDVRGCTFPSLPAFRLGDLAEAMGVKPKVIGLRPSEKIHETMDGVTTSADASRLSVPELRERLSRL